MSKKSAESSFGRVVLWVLSLAILSVGAKNFEQGITLDGPFYATIARNMVRSGNWFTLNTSIPDLNPFNGNPHLGFWVFACWLKVFPAADWALRIVNHLYYVTFMALFFYWVKRRADEKIAVIAVIVLWSWSQFSNTFSNVYLDPGALVFGTLALVLFDGIFGGATIWIGISGVALALSALYKSLTFVGFLPALALIAWQRRLNWKCLLTLFGFAFPLMVYVALLQYSPEPNFLRNYWNIQITNRFARIWSVSLLFSFEYWRQLLFYTYYLAPLALLSFFHKPKRDLLVPIVLGGSFITIFSMSNLHGGQYLVMVMPWLAWLIAIGISQKLTLTPQSLMKGTTTISILVVCVLQYLPIRTHAREPTPEQLEIGRLHRAGFLDTLYLELPPTPSPFVLSAPFAWYGDVEVRYPEPTNIPQASMKSGYFLHVKDASREKSLKRGGWCQHQGVYQDGTLWVPCNSPK